jgi:protein associated with RNAse G/E
LLKKIEQAEVSSVTIESQVEAITVCTYKYDGTEYRRWRGQLTGRRSSLIILSAAFDKEVRHPLLGIIAAGTVSTEYYWLNRWYNIFRFHQPTGELRNYYCNINVPPIFHQNVLSYIDLDMDILVAPDLSYSILDEEEFAANASRFKYSLEVQRRSYQALEQLVKLIESRQFPFNYLK